MFYNLTLYKFKTAYFILYLKVGATIGRGGENIKEIQRKTNTRIDFKDDSNEGSFH